MLDLLVEKQFKGSRSSRRKFFPRTNFSGGLTSLTQLASHEWIGVLLTLLMAAQTHIGARILSGRLHDSDSKFLDHVKSVAKKRQKKKNRLQVLEKENLLECNERWDLVNRQEVDNNDDDDGEDSAEPLFGDPDDMDADSLANDIAFMETHDLDEPRCSTKNFVQLAEMLLCFHAFYKRGLLWKSNDKDAPKQLESALRRMMLQLTSTLNRGEGTMNWNAQKIHEILHLPMQMSEYGSPSNFNAGIGESGLKHWAKRPARRALKGSIEVFTSSTACRVHEGLVIAKAANCLGVSSTQKRKVHNVSSIAFSTNPNSHESQTGKFIGQPKYTIKVNHDEDKEDPYVSAEWLTSAESVILPDAILEIFFEEYFQNLSAQQTMPIILGYTEYKLHSGELIRAHPNYGGKGALYDWAIIVDPADRYDYLLGTRIPQLVDEDGSPCLSRLESIHPDHVPGRIIALFCDPETGNDMAIVNACRPWSRKNYEYTSVITESWNLQVVKQVFWVTKDGTLVPEPASKEDQEIERAVPMYHVIPASNIKQGLFAFQEDDLLADSWPCNNAAGHVLVVHDRDQFWADEFIKF
jgi:hypothetical protein